MGVKLSDLTTETAPASNDILMIADPVTGVAKKLTVSALKTLLDGLGGGTDTTAPTIVSAVANTANTIQIVFSETVVVTTAGWSYKLNGGNWAVSSVSGSGNTWTFTMAASASPTDTILRSYNPSVGNTVDQASNELGIFTDAAVTNSIPGNQLATPGSFTATVANPTQVNLSWSDVANEVSYRLDWSANGTTGWTQIGGTIAAGSTSYSHTGLTAGSQYFYRLKAVGDGSSFNDSAYATANATPAYQTESNTFFAANTGLTTTEKNALDALVVSLKSIGWSKFKAFYPNVGGTAEKHKWNLVNPVDTDAGFRATYNAGNGTITHSATGINKTGTTSHINSKMNFSTDFALNDAHVGVHVRGTTTKGQIAGAWDTAVANGLSLTHYYGGSDEVQAYYNDLNAGVISATGAATGHYGLNRSSSTSLKAFKNGAQTGSTYTATNFGTLANIDFYFGGVNWQGTGGHAAFDGEITVCHAGTSLTDANWSTLNTAISTFNTALSR
jgi:hypothetical protein